MPISLGTICCILFLASTVLCQDEELRFPPDSISKQSILEQHDTISTDDETHFSGTSLAYITPWNNKGYDLAKLTSQKLTHIAPVWLQLKPQTADMSFSCRIEGTHDVDQGWIAEVREKNPEIKIVPRVLFEEWSVEDITSMMDNEGWSRRCLMDLMNFITRNQLNGVVLEVWSDVMIRTRGQAGRSLIEFLSSWGDAFQEKDLETIVVVGPPVYLENQVTGMFTPSHLYALGPHVDYIQMMTYDYPAAGPSGVAPYDWVKASIEAVLDGSKLLAQKLLIGINYYGYYYKPDGGHAIKFDQYLDLLKDKKSKLIWDDSIKEHILTIGKEQAYYPTLTSIELRCQLAQEYEVGIAIWDYGQGLNYFSQLL